MHVVLPIVSVMCVSIKGYMPCGRSGWNQSIRSLALHVAMSFSSFRKSCFNILGNNSFTCSKIIHQTYLSFCLEPSDHVQTVLCHVWYPIFHFMPLHVVLLGSVSMNCIFS